MFNNIPAASANFAIDLLGGFRSDMGINSNLPGTTIMRVRGTFQWALAAATPDVSSGIVAGMIVHTQGQTGVGTELPAPSTDDQDDWFYWEWIASNLTPSDLFGGTSGAKTIDVKSKRKMEEINQTAYFIVEATQSADTMAAQFRGSVLLALP